MTLNVMRSFQVYVMTCEDMLHCHIVPYLGPNTFTVTTYTQQMAVVGQMEDIRGQLSTLGSLRSTIR